LAAKNLPPLLYPRPGVSSFDAVNLLKKCSSNLNDAAPSADRQAANKFVVLRSVLAR